MAMAYAIITYLGRHTGLGVGEKVLNIELPPKGKGWWACHGEASSTTLRYDGITTSDQQYICKPCDKKEPWYHARLGPGPKACPPCLPMTPLPKVILPCFIRSTSCLLPESNGLTMVASTSLPKQKSHHRPHLVTP